ncbi:monocarboxylate transporter 14-like [Haliotis rubra]|uniref:monocarboxylate transporter 14-like n=1 Tax=Haliotis rubra TaxID=36100 RepID=UPI001EE54541|nr:monocarboxylate transporter 14-like [Haliotis rubra]XP_046565030.1 monocarboxylate transporter 14-like [Haliotis rubra]XP_046565031.1 monocarboxylate transporter 14-like [Haliotis rubra]XP_046565032.1 monocarboxylate transporter 14-like [Haliotis rubra]
MTSRQSRDIDGGWAWVVLLAAYVNLLIGPGLAYVGGIFQAVFLEQFQESVALTSWVTSLFASLLQLAGPLSSVLSSQVSCRASVITGATLLAAGLAISSFVNSLLLLLIFMGIVSGIGLGLTYSASIVVVNLFFVKRRTFVTGLALSATGAGILILPLVCRHLLDALSWRETLAILAGLSLQMAVCGAVMFPVHEHNDKGFCFKLFRKRDKRLPDADSEKGKMFTQNDSPQTERAATCEDQHLTAKDQHLAVKDLVNSTISISGSVKFEMSKIKIHEPKPLYANIGFLILCFSLFLNNSSIGIFLIHFPSFAKTFGVTESEVAFAMAMNGPALTISRVLIGAMGNDSKTDPLSIFVGLILTSALILMLTPVLATTSTTQTLVMVLMGLYCGGSYAFLTVLTIECVGLDKLAAAFGWEMIAAGTGYLVAPPIAGWIVDSTGSYANSIYLSGVLLFVAVLVIMMIPVCGGRRHQHSPHHPDDTTLEVDQEDSPT